MNTKRHFLPLDKGAMPFNDIKPPHEAEHSLSSIATGSVQG
jgi:hypothetical protein